MMDSLYSVIYLQRNLAVNIFLPTSDNMKKMVSTDNFIKISGWLNV